MTGGAQDVSSVAPVLDLLWPDVTKERIAFRALPDARHPRLLIPLSSTAAGLAALRGLRDASTARARVRTRALVVGWRTPLVPGGVLHLPGGGVTDHLSDFFGRPVVVGVHLGPARANRKPVLAVTTPAGELLGFAKLGIDPLTDRLIENEAAALTAVSGLTAPHTPRLLWRDSWAGHPLLVQTPVSRAGRATVDPAGVAAAQVAVALVAEVQVGADTYVQGLRARLERARSVEPGLEPETVNRLVTLTEKVMQHPGVSSLRCGSWHGDWRVTNMAVRRGEVSVWDWERFAHGVPLGFDALHLSLTTLAPTTARLDDIAPTLFAKAPAVLRPFDVDAGVVDLVTSLYLLELATRYVEDDQQRTGARLGDVTTWLLPTLEQRCEQTR
jgi:hypothetical protein